MISSIAIVGAGAIGCYYGGRLALAGADVRFLMRGDAAHVRAHGLTLREKDGTRTLRPVAVFEETTTLGPVDLVIVALKTTANASLASLLPPLLHRSTAVLTLQNGLGNEEYIASLVGAERVLGGLCYIGVTREAAGEITGYHTPGKMTLGEFQRPPAERAREIAARLAAVGVETRVVDDLAEARWQKLVWNIPFNGLAIAGGRGGNGWHSRRPGAGGTGSTPDGRSGRGCASFRVSGAGKLHPGADRRHTRDGRLPSLEPGRFPGGARS